MPNRDTHIVIGAAVSAIISYSIGQNFITAAFFGAIGSVIPDILEPATHWTHRKFFHSKYVFKILLVPLVISLFLTIFNIPFTDIAFYTLIGYELHLLADSTTPAGFGKRKQ